MNRPDAARTGPGRLRFSFSTILLVVAVLGILPTLLFSGFLLLRYADSERQRAERGLVESTRAIARAIDTQFAAAESALLVLRDSPFLNEGDLAAFESRLRRSTEATGRYFALVEPSGQQLINTFLPPGRPLARNDPTLWAPVFAEGRTFVTNVFTGASTGQLLAGVGVPVVRDNTVKWALTAGLFAKDFQRVMDEPGVPGDWIVSVVDRTGRHIVRSHMNEQFAGKPLVPVLIEHMRRGGIGTLPTTSLEGIPLISTVQYAPNSKWAAAVGLPVTSLEAPMRASLRDLMIAGAVVAALALGLALLAARLLSRSVATVTGMAAGLGRGEVVDPAPSRVSEMNLIARVLAQASRDLNQLTARLETQVAERTAELSNANASLTAEIKRRQESEAQVRQMQKMEAVGQLTGRHRARLQQHAGDRHSAAWTARAGACAASRIRSVVAYLDNAADGAERAAR